MVCAMQQAKQEKGMMWGEWDLHFLMDFPRSLAEKATVGERPEGVEGTALWRPGDAHRYAKP